jgi:hypothetical protein
MVFEVDHKRDEGYASRYRGGLFISKKLIVIIIIAVIVIALGVGCYFLAKSGFFVSLVGKIQLPSIPGVETNESRAQVQNVTSSFDGVNLYTLDLDQLIAIGKPAVPTLANMLNDSDASKRYAAVLGLSAIGHKDTSINVLSDLKKALGDSDVNVRVTAAELVMSFGDKEGIPVLIAELENTAILKPSEPVMPINSYASLVLTRYTDQTFAVDKAKWQEWWLTNKDKLRWDKENGKFT